MWPAAWAAGHLNVLLGFLALFLASFLALLAFSFLAFVLASTLDGSTLDGGFGLAAVLGAVVGAAFALGGGALLTAHAGVGASHVAGLLGLLDDGGVLGGLSGFVVVAGNHGEHSHSGHSGKQNFFHCFDVFWVINNVD